MKRIPILLIAACIFGCVTIPQTTNEVREAVKSGASMTKMDNQDINRKFIAVFNDVKFNADKCLNVVVTEWVPSSTGTNLGHNASTKFRSHTEKTSSETGEMVLQMDKKTSSKMPEGGYFVILADIEAVSADKTRLTIYGPSMGYGNLFEAISSWAKGKNRECPKLP